MIYLGHFEDVGYADVICTGMSRKETTKDTKRIAKKLRIKIKIKYVDRHPVGSVVLDTRTGIVALIT